ncbi:MAG: alpha/beta hydrolase [Myxococcales bacterium]
MWKFLKWTMLIIVVAIVGAYLALLQFDIPAEEVDALYTNEESEFMVLDNGARVHYRDEGNPDGPPLVLIHGSNASLHTWELWAADLGDQFRIVSMDLQGHGLTGPVPGNDYSIDAMARLVDEVVTRLGIDRFSLAGSSMGGTTAWTYAVQHPDRLNALILVGSSGYPDDDDDDEEDEGPLVFKILSSPVGRALVRNVSPRMLAEEGLKTSFFDDSLVDEAMVDRYTTLAVREGSRDATSIRFSTPRSYELALRIPEITAPTLILQGDGDLLISVPHAEKFHADIAGSKLIIYEDVGHMPMEENPEQSAADVRGFLNGVLGLGEVDIPQGDRTFKLPSSTTSEPGRYLESLGDPVPGMAGKRSSRGTPVAFATIESMV